MSSGGIKVGKLVKATYQRDGNRQTLMLPIKLDSRANFRGHTRGKKHVKSVREQRGLTQILFQSRAEKVQLPVRLKLVRIAPRRLDPHENLPMCFKSVVDGIADWLGVDDAHGFDCSYDQERAETPNTFGCRVTIEPAGGKLARKMKPNKHRYVWLIIMDDGIPSGFVGFSEAEAKRCLTIGGGKGWYVQRYEVSDG